MILQSSNGNGQFRRIFEHGTRVFGDIGTGQGNFGHDFFADTMLDIGRTGNHGHAPDQGREQDRGECDPTTHTFRIATDFFPLLPHGV